MKKTLILLLATSSMVVFADSLSVSIVNNVNCSFGGYFYGIVNKDFSTNDFSLKQGTKIAGKLEKTNSGCQVNNYTLVDPTGKTISLNGKPQLSPIKFENGAKYNIASEMNIDVSSNGVIK